MCFPSLSPLLCRPQTSAGKSGPPYLGKTKKKKKKNVVEVEGAMNHLSAPLLSFPVFLTRRKGTSKTLAFPTPRVSSPLRLDRLLSRSRPCAEWVSPRRPGEQRSRPAWRGGTGSWMMLRCRISTLFFFFFNSLLLVARCQAARPPLLSLRPVFVWAPSNAFRSCSRSTPTRRHRIVAVCCR